MSSQKEAAIQWQCLPVIITKAGQWNYSGLSGVCFHCHYWYYQIFRNFGLNLLVSLFWICISNALKAFILLQQLGLQILKLRRINHKEIRLEGLCVFSFVLIFGNWSLDPERGVLYWWCQVNRTIIPNQDHWRYSLSYIFKVNDFSGYFLP